MDKSESEIIEEMDFNVYLSLFNSIMPDNIDIYYMNNKNISDEVKRLFNKTLIKCKDEFNTPIFLILKELSEHYIDSGKISNLINNRVKWELMEELKNKYSFINKHYYNNILLDYFF
jgi:hypothetical protein